MAIQIGTVDGLINISDTIRVFVNGIIEFKNLQGIKYAQTKNIAIGTAFQRFIEPVYNGTTKTFKLSDINNPAYTKSGAEQSPARVTYCKKMGLLKVDDEKNIFEPTPLCEAIYSKEITLEEYAFILMSKQGIFLNKSYNTNLFQFLADLFDKKPILTNEELSSSLQDSFEDTNIVKTRLDIIIKSLECAKLIYKKGDQFAVNGIKKHLIIKEFKEKSSHLTAAKLDDDNKYSDYIGGFANGVFDIITNENCNLFYSEYPDLRKYSSIKALSSSDKEKSQGIISVFSQKRKDYINAIKTKPFVLLAGISGTGKSRIVRELAFKSCPPELQDEKHTTPGNYCMIEVKPNWHDSKELFGFPSSINRKYMVTPFMRFIVKAMKYPDTPFFVCLDEMNLAHVEQFFAEYLSVLETRKRFEGTIETSALIDAQVFADYFKEDPSDKSISTIINHENGFYKYYFGNKNISQDIFEDLGLHRSAHGKDTDGNDVIVPNEKDIQIITHLLMYGMTIPENLIVVGTVNMDDTTKQFSRKVIDRAMTIEMNGGQLEDMFGNGADLDYCKDETQILNMGNYAAKYISADDVIENCNAVKGNIDYIKFITGKNEDGSIIKDEDSLPRILDAINITLKDTPFEVSYRVMNELVIYLGVLLDEQGDSVTPDKFKECVDQAFDQILLMKVLPRIGGAYELFVLSNDERNSLDGKNFETKLDWLKSLTSGKSKEKLEEMIKRLDKLGFTRFWP